MHQLRLLVMLTAGLLLASTGYAQSYSQTNRAFVQSPTALGMGDAAVAFPTKSTAFFYNPAHLAHAASSRPTINLVGLRGSLSTTLLRQVRFATNTVEPALQDGFENMETDQMVALFDEAWAVGRNRAYASSDVLLPSAMLKAGGVGLGAGLFTHGRFIHHRMRDGGAGIPLINLAGQLDAMAVTSAAVDLTRFGIRDVTVGVTGKFTRRYLTLKNKLLDTFEPNEELHLLRGNSVGLDAGLLYRIAFLPLPGQMNFGLAVFDWPATSFQYELDRSLTGAADGDTAQLAQDIEEAHRQYQLSPSYRIGFAYTVPTVGGLLGETGVALDYVDYATPLIEQSLLTRLRMGVQAKVGRALSLRAGLSQGYTTVGAGLALGFAQIDYAYYGIEEGRLAGQIPSWNHSLQIALGLF